MATGRYASYFKHRATADVTVVIESAPGDVKLVIQVAQSGVKVVIEVAQSNENHGRRQLQLHGKGCRTADAGELCAHKIILGGNSPVWQAQLERWQGAGEPKRITIIVEEGEQAAAHRLIQCLYTDCLSDIETEMDLCEILGILMLADQYQVTAALSLCAQKLEGLTALGAISWELADRVTRLPAGYLEKPGLFCLLVKIQEKILQHAAAEPSLPGIGLDLEVVMHNSTLEKGLMALPLHKCASLLSDDRCRVASVNTVAAAVLLRVDHELLRSNDDDVEHGQSAELCVQIMGDVIRVPHLSSLFAAAMLIFASPLSTFMRPEIYTIGRELNHLPAELRERFTEDEDDVSIPRCWLSGRPPSTVTALEFDWEVSTAELAEKFDAGTGVLAMSYPQFFAGLHWTVELVLDPVLDNEGRTVGLYISGAYPLPLLMAGPRHGATVDMGILTPDGKSLVKSQFQYINTAGSSWGRENFFDIPPMQKWDQSRMQKWTSSTGFLTIRINISDVL